jgi:hypothetical protein
MAEKRKNYVTPVGIAIYPWLNPTRPDTKFKPQGEYRTKLRLAGEDAEAMITHLDALFDQAVEAEKKTAFESARSKKLALTMANFERTFKLADRPYVAVADDEGNETGEYDFNFKSNASFVDKKTGETIKIKLHLFDCAKPKPQPTKDVPFGGSELIISYQVVPFYTATVGAGISLRLSAVQVVKLVTSGGGSGESFGFGSAEGYVASGASEEDDSPFGSGEPAGDVSASDDDPNF